MRAGRRRSTRGTITEFASAWALLICFILLPLLNMSFVPVRYMMCEGVLSAVARRLAHADKFSDAQALMQKEQWWKNLLTQCGVTVSKEQVNLLATTSDGTRRTAIGSGGKLPPEWLPDGANSRLPDGTTSPCIYTLVAKADCTIGPLYPGPFQPVTVTLGGHCQWENLSKNPNTLDFYINE